MDEVPDRRGLALCGHALEPLGANVPNHVATQSISASFCRHHSRPVRDALAGFRPGCTPGCVRRARQTCTG